MTAAERVTGCDDPRVTDYRAVHDPELARSRGVFVAEGRLVVRRVVEDARWHVRSILVNDAAHRDLDDLLRQLPPTVSVLVADSRDFCGITGFNIHRGCLALVERPRSVSVNDVVSAGGTIVVLEAVTNADNVGGAFRNAAAFGAAGVLLSPTCCDPLYRKAVRTSMGAVLRVPFATMSDWPGGLSALSSQGFTIVALTAREPAQPLNGFATGLRVSRLALLVGSEGAGLTPEAEAMADGRVRIPMADGTDSLNLATAAGIALYALSRL
jgi:tRNA G18 (ribose-2'-O)-methylase SpoU